MGDKFSVDKIIEEKEINFYKLLPRIFQSMIKKLLYEDEVNRLLSTYKNDKDLRFINKILEYFNVSINTHFIEKLDINKRYIFVCNHPTGILDGLIILKALSSNYKCQLIANDILNHISNLNNLLLPINWIGTISKKQTINIVNALKSDLQIILFPSGEVSKLSFVGIKDKKWNSFFIKKSLKYERDIIPVNISGYNSFWFYFISTIRSLSRIKFNIEMFLLIYEVFNKQNRKIELKFGEPIPYKSLINKNIAFESNRIQTLAHSL